MTDFHPGDFFCVREQNTFTLYKVLLCGNDGLLFVRAYWPDPIEPSAANLSAFDLRTSCESIQLAEPEQAVFIANRGITAEELRDYETFVRIQQGIQSRTNRFTLLLEEANEQLLKEHFAAAVHLYTEAAPFSKYDHTIFDKRGYCLFKLGNYSEAIADFEHSLSLFNEGKDTMYYCAQAYVHSGKAEKAIEKLELLLALDEGYEAAKALMERIRKVL